MSYTEIFVAILAGLFVVLGIVFDFFDGFAARILNVSGELGKQLDSLADMITSGVVPGLIMYSLIMNNNSVLISFPQEGTIKFLIYVLTSIEFIGLLLTLAACYRLANFNIDTRQSDSFIGLPTPAMSLFVIFLPLIQQYSTIEFVQNLITNNYFLKLLNNDKMKTSFVVGLTAVLFSIAQHFLALRVAGYLLLILNNYVF